MVANHPAQLYAIHLHAWVLVVVPWLPFASGKICFWGPRLWRLSIEVRSIRLESVPPCTPNPSIPQPWGCSLVLTVLNRDYSPIIIPPKPLRTPFKSSALNPRPAHPACHGQADCPGCQCVCHLFLSARALCRKCFSFASGK